MAYEMPAPSASSSGEYLKISDGETVTLRILDSPVATEAIFERDGKKEKVFRNKFLVCKRTAVDDDEGGEPKQWEVGAGIYREINTLYENKKWGDPTRYDLTIKRVGAGKMDTRYSVTAIPNIRDLNQAETKMRDTYQHWLRPVAVSEDTDPFAND